MSENRLQITAQPDPSEAAGILVNQPVVVVEMQDKMNVGSLHIRAGGQEVETPAHTQVHNQVVALLQVNDQELAPSPYRADGHAVQPIRSEILPFDNILAAEIGPGYTGADDPRQGVFDGLYLRQFRHWATPLATLL